MQIAAASIFIVAGIMLLAETLQDPGSLTYPLVYPQVLLVLLLVLFTALLVTTRLTRPASEAAETGRQPGGSEEAVQASRGLVRPLAGLACCIGYVYAWAWVGYIPATLVFLALMLAIGGERDMRLIGAVSLSVALLILVVFMELLKIPLPGIPWEMFS